MPRLNPVNALRKGLIYYERRVLGDFLHSKTDLSLV